MCEGHLELRQPRPGSWVVRTGYSDHRRRYFTLWLPLGFDEYFMHDVCDCNELVSIRNRVQLAVQPVQLPDLRRLHQLARKLSKCIGTLTPLSHEWIQAYPPRKRRMYERAEADLAIRSFGPKDRTVKAFLKAEKVLERGKDPRMIQARGPRFNLCFGDYTRALEKRLYRCRRNWCNRLPVGGRLFAKGLNSRDRAREIIRKFDLFGFCYSLDLSRFDAHVTQDLLRVGHGIYLRAFNNDKLLRQCLSYQLDNSCYSSCWKYNSVGGRMSGDMDTALGNCLLALLITVCSMEDLGYNGREWSTFIDGDDILLFVGEPLRPGLEERFAAYGQVLKVEGCATRLSEIQHCWGRPVETVGGWLMAGDARRVISKTLVGCRHWQDPKFWQPYLGLLGHCELALSAGVPVLQEYALMLLRWSEGRMPRDPGSIVEERYFRASLEIERGKTFSPLPVTPVARASYAEAWGVEVDEQLYWERLFSTEAPPWMHDDQEEKE